MKLILPRLSFLEQAQAHLHTRRLLLAAIVIG